MKKAQIKLIEYFEKRISETNKYIKIYKGSRDSEDKTVLTELKAQAREQKTVLKYIKGGRWMK